MTGNCKVNDCQKNLLVGENERLRMALMKIAHDSYTREDERLTSSQPMMIWQLVAMRALGDEQTAGMDTAEEDEPRHHPDAYYIDGR